jgi:hypothetical protein
MESVDYRIRLGSFQTMRLMGEMTAHHALAVLPQLSPAQSEELKYFHQQSEINLMFAIDNDRPLPHTEFTYFDISDEELLDISSDVAQYLRVITHVTVDVDPHITPYNWDESRSLLAATRISEI